MNKQAYLEKVSSEAFKDELEKCGINLKGIGEMALKGLKNQAGKVSESFKHLQAGAAGLMTPKKGLLTKQMISENLKKGRLAAGVIGGGVAVAGTGVGVGMAASNRKSK